MILLILTFGASTQVFALAHSSVSPSKGKITEFPIPDGNGPFSIAVGPNHNLWFTEFGKIGKITEYVIPTPQSEPRGIVQGPGGLWFTESVGNKIGELVP